MEAIIKEMCVSNAWDGMISRLGLQLLLFKDKELGSTLTGLLSISWSTDNGNQGFG